MMLRKKACDEWLILVIDYIFTAMKPCLRLLVYESHCRNSFYIIDKMSKSEGKRLEGRVGVEPTEGGVVGIMKRNILTNQIK